MSDERLARHRRSIRLKGYDYAAAGAYFVTIAAQDRECLFGQVVDGEMRLNEAGRMVEGQWLALADRFPTVDLDEFVVMPNHFHGIILLEPASHAADPGPLDRAGMNPAPTARPTVDRASACDAGPSVGATLVVARYPVARNGVAPDGVARNVGARSNGDRAGTSPAPTATTRDHADATDDRAGMNPAPTEWATMHRAPACDAGPSVGATLVVARNAVTPDVVARPNGDRAGTSPAPTAHPAMDRANACDAGPSVGATLVVARNVIARNVVAWSDGNRAGTSPAPTEWPAMHRAPACDAAPAVGATLVVARCGVARNANTPHPAPTLGAVVGAFKSITTQAYMDGVRECGWPPFAGRLWQRNYYEHIIRGEKSLARIRDYVVDNPQRWAEDRENPSEVDKPTSVRRIQQPWET